MPLILLLTEGQFSNCKAAFALLEHLPPGSALIADKAYDSHRLCHAYFLGANDPYKSLKTALKAEIDQEAWQTLYSDTFRPFPRSKNGRFAVKVINHFGDEIMKVLEV